MDEKKKIKKTPNFSDAERHILIKLSNKYKQIIENKKTDGIIWREKEECWRKIEMEYNASTTGPPRNTKQLKNKYESVKKDMKKKHALYKSYNNGTGGGKYIPPPSPTTEEEKILYETISISVEGVSGKSLDVIQEKELTDFTETNVDGDSPSAKLWQTPKQPVLKKINSIRSVRKVEEPLNFIFGEVVENQEISQDTLKPIQDKENIANTRKPIQDRENVANEDMTGDDQKKSWQVRRRPVLPKKKNMSSVSSKFDLVAEKKLEVLELNQIIAQNKIKQDEEQHKQYMEYMELKEEKARLKIQ